jgi:hypothetical protein
MEEAERPVWGQPREVGTHAKHELGQVRIRRDVRPQRSDCTVILSPERTCIARTLLQASHRVFELAETLFHAFTFAAAGLRSISDRAAPRCGELPTRQELAQEGASGRAPRRRRARRSARPATPSVVPPIGLASSPGWHTPKLPPRSSHDTELVDRRPSRGRRPERKAQWLRPSMVALRTQTTRSLRATARPSRRTHPRPRPSTQARPLDFGAINSQWQQSFNASAQALTAATGILPPPELQQRWSHLKCERRETADVLASVARVCGWTEPQQESE